MNDTCPYCGEEFFDESELLECRRCLTDICERCAKLDGVCLDCEQEIEAEELNY